MSTSISRRHVLAATLPLANSLADAATSQRAAKEVVQPKPRPFDLKNGTLSPGRLRDLMEANRRNLHDLEADRHDDRGLDHEGSAFVFEAHRPIALELRIRTPYWATSGMPDNPKLQAFLLKREQLYGDPVDPLNNYELQGDPRRAPDLHESMPLTERIPNHQPLTFRTVRQPKNLTLIPLNRIFGERYAVYWRVNS